MILVAVGTYIHGFDELVAAADAAAAELGLAGFAQIGHSRVIPKHLAWERFLPPAALAGRIAQAQLVICHGGIGLLGEAMRAAKPLIVMPRRGRPTPACPAGDQSALVAAAGPAPPDHRLRAMRTSSRGSFKPRSRQGWECSPTT